MAAMTVSRAGDIDDFGHPDGDAIPVDDVFERRQRAVHDLHARSAS